jgi:hypothetical protein
LLVLHRFVVIIVYDHEVRTLVLLLVNDDHIFIDDNEVLSDEVIHYPISPIQYMKINVAMTPTMIPDTNSTILSPPKMVNHRPVYRLFVPAAMLLGDC